VLDEVSRLGRELEAASPVLAGSVVAPSSVALLNSYPSRWSLEAQRQHASFDYVEHLVHHYRSFARRNVAVDIVAPTAPLGGYRVVVAPALTILDEGDGERLRDFVEAGGHLVLTIRTGVKDADNALLPSRPPGPLAECAGVEVEDYYALLEPLAVEGDGLGGQASIWAERVVILDPATVRVLARFGAGDEWLAGRPAITVRTIGKGRVYYVAAYLDAGVLQVLTDLVLSTADVAPLVAAPPDVEARARLSTNGDEVLILVNHGPLARSVDLPWEAHDHVAGSAVGKLIELAGYTTVVLTRLPAAARLSNAREQGIGSRSSS
jgi:beta-galactosidase